MSAFVYLAGRSAVDVSYNNQSSGLNAVNVQDAIDELAGGGGGGGANQALSNLTTTAINADLIPDTGDSYDIGSVAFPFATIRSTGLTVLTGPSGDSFTLFAAAGGNVSYTFPTTFGAAGSVLTDMAGDGVLTFQPSGGGSSVVEILLSVNLTSDTVYTTGNDTTFNFNNTIIDTNVSWTGTTWTADFTGQIEVTLGLIIGGAPTGGGLILSLYKNGVPTSVAVLPPVSIADGGANCTINMAYPFAITSGDTVHIQLFPQTLSNVTALGQVFSTGDGLACGLQIKRLN